MTILDPRYISSTPLQWIFLDKDLGTPLVAGVVTFYEQDNQNVKKDIFQLDNSAPTGFSILNNPITLTSIGTFADDNGNDIIPYFFPFDDEGNPQLYFVTVYNKDGVFQFSRQDWPPNEGIGGGNSSSQNNIINYVPNGQFLLHNDYPVSSIAGIDTVNYIAQGGWTFEKETLSTSTDTISFIREISSSTNPNVDANPRYFFQINTNGTDLNYSRKDLCLTFPDVNKFAGDPLLQSSVYTFSFQSNVISGGSTIVDIRLRKIFGSGGSATTDISLGTIELSLTENLYNITFKFGENSGDNVGTLLDDDYLQLCVRFPNSAQIVQMTDFVLTPGSNPVVAFPQTTNAEFLSDSTTGSLPTPNPDGSDLYLPIKLGPKGFIFDKSEIGCLVSAMGNSSPLASLYCDGTQYAVGSRSSLGIPYRRLFNELMLGSPANIPLYGTGKDFASVAINSGASSSMVIATNKSGLQTNPSNGGISPGFTYSLLVAGNSTIGYRGFSNSSGAVLGVSNFTSVPLSNVGISGGTSGMAFASYKNPAISPQYYSFVIIALSAAALGNGAGVGKYFTFSSNAVAYYMWFQTATETDPAPGGTAIKVNLPLTMVAADVSSIIANALGTHQVNIVNTVAASMIPPGAFFNFYANAIPITVWYNVAGSGTAPVANSLIPVYLSGTETAAQVATITQIAINSVYFATPDLRGVFLRGSDPTAQWDVDQGNRGSLIQSASSADTGSLEIDTYGFHNHILTTHNTSTATLVGNTVPFNSLVGWMGGPAGGADGVPPAEAFVNINGFPETRPVNMYVDYFIKY